jgi:hypothetical protein
MHEIAFDRLSRRASLTALGTAGVVGLLAHAPAAEGKQSTSKKAKKKCKKQVDQCLSSFTAACAGDPTCLALTQKCCPLIGTCDFSAFAACTSPPQN